MMILADKKHKGIVARVIQQAGSGWMHRKLMKCPKIVIIINKRRKKEWGLVEDASSLSLGCLSTSHLPPAQTAMNGLLSTLHNWQQFNM